MINLNAIAQPALASRTRTVFLAMAAVGAALIAYDHRVHLIGALPYLLLFACPLMHVFMMHGHDGHAHDDKVASDVLRLPPANDDI